MAYLLNTDATKAHMLILKHRAHRSLLQKNKQKKKTKQDNDGTHSHIFTFTFILLTDALIQSDLQTRKYKQSNIANREQYK